jgi:hypothetical protein
MPSADSPIMLRRGASGGVNRGRIAISAARTAAKLTESAARYGVGGHA